MYTFEPEVNEPPLKRFKRASEGYADDIEADSEFDFDSELQFEIDSSLKG